MNRMEIVVPRASWNNVFSDDTGNLLIPVVPYLTKSRKGPATMHLPCPTFLSKEWGEVHLISVFVSPIIHLHDDFLGIDRFFKFFRFIQLVYYNKANYFLNICGKVPNFIALI
jgi:hypothetical protein